MLASSTLPEKLWTSAQVASYLQLREESIRRLARQGKIIGYKIGDGPRRIGGSIQPASEIFYNFVPSPNALNNP